MAFGRKRREQKKKDKAGGVLFYITLVALLLISVSNFLYLFDLWNEEARTRAQRFVFGIITGSAISVLFIRNHFSVLVHELKHAIVSGFAGNKFKGFKIGRDSGHFEYAYSKESEHHNATISLAPYWLPLFTVPLFMFGIHDFVPYESLILVIGIGYGIDLVCGLRDVSPHQTDFSGIRGGFVVGLSYVVLMHLVIFTFLVAWAYQGSLGLKYMFYGLWNTALGFAAHFYNRGGM